MKKVMLMVLMLMLTVGLYATEPIKGISKAFTADTGMIVANGYHVIGNVFVRNTDKTITVTIHSYVSEEAYDAGKPLVKKHDWTTETVEPINCTNYDGLIDFIYTTMLATDPYLENGTIDYKDPVE